MPARPAGLIISAGATSFSNCSIKIMPSLETTAVATLLDSSRIEAVSSEPRPRMMASTIGDTRFTIASIIPPASWAISAKEAPMRVATRRIMSSMQCTAIGKSFFDGMRLDFCTCFTIGETACKSRMKLNPRFHCQRSLSWCMLNTSAVLTPGISSKSLRSFSSKALTVSSRDIQATPIYSRETIPFDLRISFNMSGLRLFCRDR
mmetsp:Transcript_127981/g.303935  ORF Transcript_127981/g.303935 Transcript_127981/m.303935 type:complete len:205 (+) Transcript_127981:539-1153(+)